MDVHPSRPTTQLYGDQMEDMAHIQTHHQHLIHDGSGNNATKLAAALAVDCTQVTTNNTCISYHGITAITYYGTTSESAPIQSPQHRLEQHALENTNSSDTAAVVHICDRRGLNATTTAAHVQQCWQLSVPPMPQLPADSQVSVVVEYNSMHKEVFMVLFIGIEW